MNKTMQKFLEEYGTDGPSLFIEVLLSSLERARPRDPLDEEFTKTAKDVAVKLKQALRSL